MEKKPTYFMNSLGTLCWYFFRLSLDFSHLLLSFSFYLPFSLSFFFGSIFSVFHSEHVHLHLLEQPLLFWLQGEPAAENVAAQEKYTLPHLATFYTTVMSLSASETATAESFLKSVRRKLSQTPVSYWKHLRSRQRSYFTSAERQAGWQLASTLTWLSPAR